MIKAIAIDDEPMALEVIRSLSEKVTLVEFSGYFTDVFQAKRFLEREHIDIIFLDIKMPDMSGIEFIRSLQNPPMVIFTTAFSEHAVESFELDAIDYLLKPFSLTRFLKACNKAYGNAKLRKPSLNGSPTSVFIKSGYEKVRVDFNDILYAEGAGNYVVFVTANRKIASRLTMSEAEALLSNIDFIRIHRSYIVVRRHIKKINKRSLWIGSAELPIGPAYSSGLQDLI